MPKSQKIYVALVLAVAVMLAIFGAVSGKYLVLFCAIVFAVVFPFFCYLEIKKAVKLYFQRISESTGANELELEISFNDDKIVIYCVNSNGTTFIEYKSIVEFVKTKNMYLMFTKARQFVAIDKTAFAEAEERRSFLKFLESRIV